MGRHTFTSINGRSRWEPEPRNSTTSRQRNPVTAADPQRFNLEEAIRRDPYLLVMIHRMRLGTWRNNK